jgi:hypothetical protein
LPKHNAVREFCEPFKTPWEFYRRDRQYEVLLCAGDGQFDGSTKLDNLPGLRLRINKAPASRVIVAHGSKDYVDIGVNGSVDASVPI